MRAIVHGSFQSARLPITEHDDWKAGQAARTSSRDQPGRSANEPGTKAVFDGGTAGSAGDTDGWGVG
ncbi:hypothetical protein GCM10007386_25340 [Pseudoduganella dura]|nr:hypothetical protein GCM10007386_25340 [Pseudoduganella dura]